MASAVSASDVIRAYIKASQGIMGTGRQDVEAVAGYMYPNGGWDGYQVSVRVTRHVDQAAQLVAAVAKAIKTNGGVQNG